MILSLNRYYKYVYYHTVSRHEAVEKLSQADTQVGTFLIRESDSNPGQHYTLSVYDGATIRHYRIYILKNRFYINPHIKFDSLNDLVHHYMMGASGLTCSLTVSIQKHAKTPRANAIHKQWEINKSQITFSKCINVQESGESWKGSWGYTGQTVMIKTNIATDITQETFLKEANILEKFRHMNIISLYGVCTEDYPFYIVTEPMNGNLSDHLPTTYTTPAKLVDVAIQIADGMIYLGEQDYIHCDLRAANILVDLTTVKIANFHHAQHLNGNKYWTIDKGTKLDLKWTAPEGYTLNQLSVKSDVWSFGILLWELASKGKEPFFGMTNEDISKAVLEGYCMPTPKNCPKPFKKLMANCWKQNSDERPSFLNIFHALTK